MISRIGVISSFKFFLKRNFSYVILGYRSLRQSGGLTYIPHALSSGGGGGKGPMDCRQERSKEQSALDTTKAK